jgi:hypothetical protein
MIDLTLNSDEEQERVEPRERSQASADVQEKGTAEVGDELEEDPDFALPPPLPTKRMPDENSQARDILQKAALEQTSGDQDVVMNDIQEEEVENRNTKAKHAPLPNAASSSDNEAEAEALAEHQRSRRRSVRSTRSSISSVRRSKGVPSERMEVDDSDAEDGEPNLTSSQMKRKAKDKSLPPPLLGPYQAARQGTVPPVGKKLAESRDSSAQIDDSAAEEIEGAMTAQAQSQAAPTMRRTASDPTKPSSMRRAGHVLKSSRPRKLGPNGEILDDEDSDEDAVYVTSVAAGSAPAKPRKSMQEREAEKAEREARRKAKEKRKEKKRGRRAIPSFKKKLTEEAIELEEAYRTRTEQIKAAFGLQPNDKLDDDLLGVSWKIFESFEPTRKEIGKTGERSDLHTVKFWPYHLPFPGRRKNEAIVAMAGWCEVRVFLLSKERGVSELWNAIDESFSWEREDEVENFLAMAWTYEVRDKETSISPYWQKWPLLCLAGNGREIKILDGYSGTTVKIIQGHGGVSLLCLCRLGTQLILLILPSLSCP